MHNQDVRERIKTAGIYHWQIAEELKIQDSYFSRMLRHELPPEKKQQIFEIIDRLEAEKEQEAAR